MGREEEELKAAKRGYKDAEREGNHEEEARWANVIGDILKQRGEYVEALRWLRIDYEVSMKHLPQKQLLPTCQSLGEVYLRLDQFKEALLYQKKHLQLAKDSDDLIEQQRASTQLGRTYHEIFTRSESDHYAKQNAKKYFKSAMKLAEALKKNPPPCVKSCFFLKELIDSYNNMGMLEMDLDNFKEAKKFLLDGLRICDEEEVSQNDDARSRLNHNLGFLYTELRNWPKAKEHIERDIVICHNIGHTQGEAKGYINLGELHYRVQRYPDAYLCYQKAHTIASCLEDEDALISQICQNIEIVKKAEEVLKDLKREEQRLKKLERAVADAKGTASERKRLLEELACLDSLIEKSCTIAAWDKHRDFAKKKKKVTQVVCDKEKLGDSFLYLGESYQKLRNFLKARKWYMKSWNIYRSIGNLEGQALAKINIGGVLDSSGDWPGALQAFEEGYKLAAKGNLPSVQLSALENMHYSHMIRFDNDKEAKKLQLEIKNLKQTLNAGSILQEANEDHCSESDTIGDESDEASSSGTHGPYTLSRTDKDKLTIGRDGTEDLVDDIPLSSLVKRRVKNKVSLIEKPATSVFTRTSTKNEIIGRKRVRVVISDDESDCEMDPVRWDVKHSVGDVASSERENRTDVPSTDKEQINNVSQSKDAISSASTPCPVEESICSFRSPIFTEVDHTEFRVSGGAAASASKSIASAPTADKAHISSSFLQSQNSSGFEPPTKGPSEFLAFKVGERMIYVDVSSCMQEGHLCIEDVKAEVACVYFLQLSDEGRAKGLLPVIGQLKCCGKELEPYQSIEDVKSFISEQKCIELFVTGWVPKRLLKLYVDCCKKLSEAANVKLLKKLYNLEVSEDDIIVSDCQLQDLSATPFLNALQAHKTMAVLDISHNLLGNDTIEKLQKIFTSSSQKYGGLMLDMHCNRFGPTALFQICECPVLYARLEVLNLSQNRLTDACSSYLFTILQNCKALYSLNIEQCSITSRTIQRVADALHEESVLSHLSIGKNSPISGNSMINLFSKVASLKRFSELSLTGIRLNKLILDQLCKLAKTTSLSGLFLGATSIGADGAVTLIDALSSGSRELLKLDMSSCCLTSQAFAKVCSSFSALNSIFHLDLSGNPLGQERLEGMVSLLMNPFSSLRTLILNRCNLGLAGIVQLLRSLSDNDSLEELHVAENTSTSLEKASPWSPLPHHPSPAHENTKHNSNRKEAATCEINTEFDDMEVADSEDDEPQKNTTNVDTNKNNNLSKSDGSSASSCRGEPQAGSQIIHELCEAVLYAKQLKMIDLSRNRLDKDAVESLYSAWGLGSGFRDDVFTRKHITKDCIHFFVEGVTCCGVKPCCRKE
ncbi:hypothetical protein LUZ63_007162 [Rhynchospora breviuscula]|uniref:Protein TONSOKU n=1 Tax=Rhynchospora breviuscula TaxID=2022672 RepID=A0A9Q0CR74_9POAL|nr:hypothetical protein LUZ63_007162 [Rhynchospora breviuscula]